MDLSDYRLCSLNGRHYAVACGESSKTFHGMMELNDTAFCFLKTLKETGSEELTVQTMAARFAISEEKAREDLTSLLQTLAEEQPGSDGSAREILQEKGVLISTISGVSMRPLLKDRRDSVVVRPLKTRLKRYDVALYESGEKLVLHRVLKDAGDAYIIRGDNCLKKEFIPDAQILGIAEGFYIKNRYVSVKNGRYRCYARLWTLLFPLRKTWKRVRSVLGRIKRKLIK